METQLPRLRRVILPIAFIGLFVVVSLVIWRAFGGPVPLESNRYRFTMSLNNAADLYPGSAVTIAGVTVGRIKTLKVEGDHARVVADLDAAYAPLRRGARVIRRTKSLLGEGYIEVAPGPLTAPVLPDGGALSAANVEPSQTLDQVLDIFGPHSRRDLQQLIRGFAGAVDGRGQQISEIFGRAAPTADALDVVARQLDDQGNDLERAVSGSADVMDAMSGDEGALQAAVTSGNRVLSITARRSKELAATVAGLPGFTTELRTTSRALLRTAPDLDRAVTAVRRATPYVSPLLQSLNTAAPQFTGLFRELTPTIREGKRSLPAVDQILRAADSGLAHAYPQLRELVPFVRLLSELKGSLSSFFGSTEQLLNGTIPGPFGQPVTTFGGIPSVWNEIVAGWKKRLPTNRPNPYPRPGAFDELKSGALLSYDCRQLGNHLYLPPTGTGSPPCRSQGPWEFDGKSRYYPRLELAAP